MDLYAEMPYRVLDVNIRKRPVSRLKKSRSMSVCKEGYTKRRAYTTKSGKRVKSGCVKAKGLAKRTGGKKRGKKIDVKLRRGELKAFGYALKAGAEKRHEALAKAIKKYGANSVGRKIVFLRTLRKNETTDTGMRQFRKLNVDVKWIQKSYKK